MTTAFDSEAAKQEGARPRALIQIDLPISGTIYLSDQQITLGGDTYRPLIKEWGDILVAEDAAGNFDITILNHNDPAYGRFSDYEKSNILTNATVRVYKWFEGLASLDKSPEFKGVIDDWHYNSSECSISVNDGTHQEHKKLPAKTLNYLDYTNARQEDIGKFFPIIYGETGEVLNAQKINKGYGSAPSILINKALRKYLVAGHVSYNVPTAVWCTITGISDGYAYMEGCTANANDGGYSTITLPASMLCGYFLSAMTTGNYFANTAQNPQNVCDRNTGTTALLNATYPLLDVMVGSLDKQIGTIHKVKIATSAAHSGCRTRWAGPKAKLYSGCSAGATSIQIDSGAGFDNSGYMDVANGDRISYTSLTEDSSGSFWTVGGIPASGEDAILAHSANDPVVMVGPWYTLSTAEVDITADRDWSNFDFYKFEIIIEWQSGANYTPSYVGFRVEFELSEYPEVYVPIKGWTLTNRRNAIEQIKHIYTNYLGRAPGDIGSTFSTAIADLEALGYKTDFSANEEINSKDLITRLLKECQARFWLDGDGKPQVKIFKFGQRASRTISYDTDIVDPDGTGFVVKNTGVDQIYNEVYVKFAKDYATGDYTQEYHINTTDASPADASRVASAAQSKADYRTTNRLTVECPDIQDPATALLLLQYSFDYYHRQRKVCEFAVSLKQHGIAIGDIVWPSHPLNPGSKSMEVTNILKSGNILKITVREYGDELVLSDGVRFSDSVTLRYGQGYGKDGYGAKYGGNWVTA